MDKMVLRLVFFFVADDIDPADWQRAFDAAHVWANALRFQFSIGPRSQFSCFWALSNCRLSAPFGEHSLSHVRTYTHLGVTLRERLCLASRVNDEFLRHGEHKMGAYRSWTNSAVLPLSLVECNFERLERLAVCFGLEVVLAGIQLRRSQSRFQQWGRRLLM